MTQIIISKVMDQLNTFLNLLAMTEGRDKFLRLIQYACLHSVDHSVKGPTYKVYQQMRMVRKILRFLRTLEYSSKIKQQLPKLKNSLSFFPSFIKHITSILQNLFNVLYFLSDHRVCLGQLGVIDKRHAIQNYHCSMKFYFFQNVFGVLHNLILMSLQILKKQQQGQQADLNKIVKSIKMFAFDLIKCLLDCIVALFYLKEGLPAKKVGILGVITSIMGIMQVIGII